MTSAAAYPADSASRAEDPLLAARAVSKRFGALQVLEDVTLQVGPGEAVGIVGPNGAGKTTLLDMIAGAVRPDGGSCSSRDVTSVGWGRPDVAGPASGARTRYPGRSPV